MSPEKHAAPDRRHGRRAAHEAGKLESSVARSDQAGNALSAAVDAAVVGLSSNHPIMFKSNGELRI